MTSTTGSAKRGFPWGNVVLAFFAFGIAGYAIAVYLSGSPLASGFVQGKQQLEGFAPDALWTAALIVHAAGGSLALIAGGLQWVLTRSALRTRRRRLFRKIHIVTGITYCAAIFAASLGAAYMAVQATGGVVSSLGFALLDISWIFTTAMALYLGNKVRICRDPSTIEDLRVRHRNWMVRSFSLTAAAITLRIWLPLFTGAFGIDFLSAYVVIAWLCWVPNLAVAEIMVRRFNPAPKLVTASA